MEGTNPHPFRMEGQDYESWHHESRRSKNCHRAIVQAGDNLIAINRDRYSHILKCVRLYSSRAVTDIFGAEHNRTVSPNRLKMNICKSVVDTATAEFGSKRHRVRFITKGGSGALQEKAITKSKFVHGQFYRHKHHRKAVKVFKDAVIIGDGFMLITPNLKTGKIECARLFPGDVFIDESCARDGEPLDFFHITEIPIDKLVAKHRHKAKEIRESQSKRGQNTKYGLGEGKKKTVTVYEAWIINSGDEKGRHVKCTTGTTLVNEEYDDDELPLVAYRWNDRQVGYYGEGAIDDIQSLQVEVNIHLRRMQQLMNLATTRVYIHEGSNLRTLNMTNAAFPIQKFSTTPPIVQNDVPFHPEFRNWLLAIKDEAYELAGISKYSATATVPTGVTSGEAQREAQYTQSKRYLEKLDGWDEFGVDCGRRYLKCAKMIDKATPGGYKIIGHGDRMLEDLDFGEVFPDDEDYTMQPFPTSFLPETPAGKISTIKDLAEVDQDYAKELLYSIRHLDTDKIASRMTGPRRNIERIISDILNGKKMRMPDAHLDLGMGVREMSLALNEAEANAEDEVILESMRKWISRAESVIRLAQDQAMAVQQQVAPQQGPPIAAQQQITPEQSEAEALMAQPE